MNRTAALLGIVVMLGAGLAGCIGGGTSTDAAGEGAPTVNNSSGPPTGEEVDAGKRPHVHDRWQTPSGEAVDEIALVDREIEVRAYGQEYPLLFNFCEQGNAGRDVRVCAGDATFRPGEWGSDEAKIVPPGTANITVTLDYDDAAFDRVQFYYMTRKDPGEWRDLGMLAPGRTKSVEVGTEEADDGHAQVSGWRFLVEARGNPVGARTGTGIGVGTVDVGSGSIEAEIVAHRTPGELPREPPHPDFWEKDAPPTDRYKIGSLEGSTEGYVDVGPVNLEPSEQPTPTSGPGLAWRIVPGFVGQRDDDPANPAKVEGNRTVDLVPPGTSTLFAQVAVSGDPGGLDQPEVCLYGQDLPSGTFPGTKIACEPFEDGAGYTFEKAISDDETDSYYTETGQNFSFSRWTFYVWVRPGNQQTHAARFSGSVTARLFVADQAEIDLPALETGS